MKVMENKNKENSPKKRVPVYLVILLVAMSVGLVFIPKVGDLSASKSEVSKKIASHYEAELGKLKVSSFKKEEIKTEEMKKGVLILNFWASWCLPCLEEFPSLVKLVDEFGPKGLKVVGINSDEDEIDKNIKKTIKKYGLNFPIVKDLETKITDSFMIQAIPVSIIYHDGKVIEVSKGKKDFSSIEFKEKVASLLK